MAVTTLNGITYNCVETFSNAASTWAEWANPWVDGQNGAPFDDWVAASPTSRTVIDTQDLIPSGVASDPNWLTECAAGDFNTYASQFAQNMVAGGLGYSVIRLEHEMNGTWEVGSLGTTQAEWTQWDQCWDQEVTSMRAVAGANFLFDWNVNADYQVIPLADFYPGNAYVDIIGIDAYDQSASNAIPAVGQPGRFQALAALPEDINDLLAFAKQQGKPLSIPEWGTVSSQGDDAAYVQGIASIVANNNVAYQSYFNANDDGILPLDPSVAPLTTAAYVAAFGNNQ
jgi:hypothetical protein